MEINEIKTVSVDCTPEECQLDHFLKDFKLAESLTKARNLIREGAVRINEEKIQDEKFIIKESIFPFEIRIGKRVRFIIPRRFQTVRVERLEDAPGDKEFDYYEQYKIQDVV